MEGPSLSFPTVGLPNSADFPHDAFPMHGDFPMFSVVSMLFTATGARDGEQDQRQVSSEIALVTTGLQFSSATAENYSLGVCLLEI